jgi:hypothetical protein
VASGVAIGFGSATLAAKRDYASVPASSTADAFARDKLFTNIAWGVALAAVAAAVLFWVFAPDRGTTSASGKRGGASTRDWMERAF